MVPTSVANPRNPSSNDSQTAVSTRTEPRSSKILFTFCPTRTFRTNRPRLTSVKREKVGLHANHRTANAPGPFRGSWDTTNQAIFQPKSSLLNYLRLNALPPSPNGGCTRLYTIPRSAVNRSVYNTPPPAWHLGLEEDCRPSRLSSENFRTSRKQTTSICRVFLGLCHNGYHQAENRPRWRARATCTLFRSVSCLNWR